MCLLLFKENTPQTLLLTIHPSNNWGLAIDAAKVYDNSIWYSPRHDSNTRDMLWASNAWFSWFHHKLFTQVQSHLQQSPQHHSHRAPSWEKWSLPHHLCGKKQVEEMACHIDTCAAKQAPRTFCTSVGAMQTQRGQVRTSTAIWSVRLSIKERLQVWNHTPLQWSHICKKAKQSQLGL